MFRKTGMMTIKRRRVLRALRTSLMILVHMIESGWWWKVGRIRILGLQRTKRCCKRVHVGWWVRIDWISAMVWRRGM
jgi:hypothetical protein